jgi:ribosomal protein S18 acetylase RimI-like enzyme
MSNATPFVEDEFLGQCLGHPVIRLRAADAARDAIEHAGKYPRWMIETKVAVGDVATIRALEDDGFGLVDTNVQLTRAAPSETLASDARCRMATPTDEAGVRQVAATSFSHTRFHLDPRIAEAAANRVKEEWAANFFTGRRGDWMVVAEDAQGVAGFLQLLRAANGAVIIDLIAVSERGRNQGLARAMIECAATQCLGRPAAMIVGTQIANIASLALYDSLGFRVSQANYILHLHGEGFKS